jgi:hypothetical protein
MSPSEPGLSRWYERDESEAQRLDRNFGELLQELRVAETGVQILFAFLLSIAFQQRFAKLTDVQLDIYLGTLVAAAIAATLLIAPVAIHRIVFRRRLKLELVTWTSRLAMGGLAFLMVSILGAVLLIVDVVAGPWPAAVITVCVGLVCGTFWLALPLRWRALGRRELAEWERGEQGG